MADVPRWRVPANADFRWRAWDGEFVLYHCNSGDTHRMNAFSAEVLRALGEQPATSAELLRQLSTRLALEPDETLRANLEALLARFHDFGLIEPEHDRPLPGAAGSR